LDWRDDLFVAMAERWRVEQEQVGLMAQALGSRCLVLRYEDVVADPATARRSIARLIDVDTAQPTGQPASPNIVLPWETWKADALADVHSRRVDSWQADLGLRRGRVVSAVCGRIMDRFGYRRTPRERIGDAALAAALSPVTQRRRRAYRKGLLGEIEWINGVTV
jgi:hypothetical protein